MRAHASVHDLWNSQLGEHLVGVDLWVDSGQKRKRPRLAASARLVLDVVNDQPIGSEHPDSSQLLRSNLEQPFRVRLQIRRCYSVETISR